MISKISYVLGFIICLISFLWFRGTAIELKDYFYSFLTMGVGIIIIWLGNRDIFTKEKSNDKKT